MAQGEDLQVGGTEHRAISMTIWGQEARCPCWNMATHKAAPGTSLKGGGVGGGEWFMLWSGRKQTQGCQPGPEDAILPGSPPWPHV